METLDDKVMATISEVLGVPREKVTPDAYLVEDLGSDSLDAVELALMLEDHFHTRLDDGVILALVTVQDVIDVVRRLVETEQGGLNG